MLLHSVPWRMLEFMFLPPPSLFITNVTNLFLPFVNIVINIS